MKERRFTLLSSLLDGVSSVIFDLSLQVQGSLVQGCANGTLDICHYFQAFYRIGLARGD